MQTNTVAQGATRRSERPKRTPLDTDDFVLDIDAEIIAAEVIAAETPGRREEADVKEEQAAMAPGSMKVALAPQAIGQTNAFSGIGAPVADMPVKKKRGRPRKHPIPVPTDADQAPVVKRPRGRPRGSGKHQRAALARSLSLSLTTSSSDLGVEDHLAPRTGDQHHGTPPPIESAGGEDQTPVSNTPVSNLPDLRGTPLQTSQGGRRRRRKGSRPSRGV